MTITKAALFAAAALTLAACGTPTIVVQAPTTAPAATSAAPAPAPAPAAASNPEADFLDHVDSMVGYTGSTDDALVTAGEAVCDFLDEGGTPVEVIGMAVEAADNEAGQEAIAAVISGAVTYLCPRHYDAMRSAVSS